VLITRVLVTGGGSVGLMAAVLLAHQGIDVVVVEKQAGPSIHPRATGLGTRTREILRQAGLQDALNEASVPMAGGGLGKISATTLAESNLAGITAPPPPTYVPDPISPVEAVGMCPQNRLDGVLLSAARERGVTVRYSATLVSFEQDDDGVTAVLDNDEVIRADYMIAADGVRSEVRQALGIGTSGPGNLGDSLMNILFRADLIPYTQGHRFTLCNITTPDSTGMLVTVDSEKDWVFHTKNDGAEYTPERCQDLLRKAIGDPALEVEILSVLRWRPRGQLADSFQQGRVFLAGDAAHTVPPIGAFGLNTGIADAHNLAWKLAAVLTGTADPSLLDTYETERRPVAVLTLEQSLLRAENPRLHWNSTAEERAAAGVINAPVVHMGYRYDSAAVIDAKPELPSRENVTENFNGDPGSRLPHVWLEPGLSTLDLVGTGYALLTHSDKWTAGPGVTVHKVDVPIPGLTGEGALLVRPDHVIAWRATSYAGQVPSISASASCSA
jgi:2-polyprenyl-6-methoxyphenol hydroxylase-like FAD-dependent oxidoreductase